MEDMFAHVSICMLIGDTCDLLNITRSMNHFGHGSLCPSIDGSYSRAYHVFAYHHYTDSTELCGKVTLYMGSGDSNSNHQACSESNLSTEPCLQSHCILIRATNLSMECLSLE